MAESARSRGIVTNGLAPPGNTGRCAVLYTVVHALCWRPYNPFLRDGNGVVCDPSRTPARPCPSPCAIVVCAGVQRHHGHGWKLVYHSAVSHSKPLHTSPTRVHSHSQPKHTPLHSHSGTASGSPSSPSPGCSTTQRRTASLAQASVGFVSRSSARRRAGCAP